MELLRVSVENAALGGASKKYQSDPDIRLKLAVSEEFSFFKRMN